MARDTLTAQQERFAQLVVVYGTRQRVAYRKAFPLAQAADNSIDVRASELMRHPKVAARISELRDIAAAKLTMTVESIGKQIARIANLDLRDCFDDKGALLPPHEMPENVALALDGIDVVEMAGGMQVTVPGKKNGKNGEAEEPAIMHVPMYTKKVRFSRAKAVELAAQWRKMLVQKVEVGEPGEFTSMTDEQLAEEEAALDKDLALIERARKRKKVQVKAHKQLGA